jgi:hypothetical protein
VATPLPIGQGSIPRLEIETSSPLPSRRFVFFSLERQKPRTSGLPPPPTWAWFSLRKFLENSIIALSLLFGN